MMNLDSRFSIGVAAVAVLCTALISQRADAQQAGAAAPPPCATAAHREFDFWLGDWAVHDDSGTLQGHNRIGAAEGGCVITEHWIGASGTTGRSINYYHPGERLWHQQWISPGTIIRIAGAWEDGEMRLSGDIYYVATGVSAPFRGIWTPHADGRVEQLFEQASAQGEWSTWFRGWYTRLDDADTSVAE